MARLLLVLLLFISLLARAQEADSLRRVIEALPEDTAKVDAINALVFHYREKNNHEGAIAGAQAIALAEKLGYQRGLAEALEHVAWINYRKGSYLESFELSTRALRINESLNNQQAIARCLNNIAAVSYERKLYPEAIAGFQRAYRISHQLRDSQTAVRSLNNISFTFLAMKSLDSAEWYAQQAMRASPDSKKILHSFSLRMLGDIEVQRNNWSEALRYFQECLRVSEETNNVFVKASALHRIGHVYFETGQYPRALDVLKENIALATNYGYVDELERTHKLIADVYSRTGRPALALEHLHQYLELHDSLNEQRNGERIALMQAKFESEIKQSRIDLLTKDSQLKSEELARQKIWRYFFMGLIGFSIVVLVGLYRANVRFKTINTELKEKNAAITRQTRQLQGVGITKDKLLSIISHDLRSPLNGFRGLLNLFRKDQLTPEEMKNFTHKLDHRLNVLNDDLDNLLQWTQTQLHGLQVDRGSVPVHSTIASLLQVLQDQSQEKHITIQNLTDQHTHILADANHVKIILRNIISNAIKFTPPNGRITISAKELGKRVAIEISDTGIGMEQEEVNKLFNPGSHFTKTGTGNEKGLGVGLLLTKEFLDKNDATVTVTSAPNEGTTFLMTFAKA